MITGGDRASPADCRRCARAAPGARLLNAYGLTETTITSTLFDVGRASRREPAHRRGVGGRPPGPVPVGTAIRTPRSWSSIQDLNPLPRPANGGRGLHRRLRRGPGLPRAARPRRPSGSCPTVQRVPEPDVPHRRPRTLARGPDPRGHRAGGPAAEDARLPGRARRDRARPERPPGIGDAAVVAREVGPGDRQLVAYYTWRPAPLRLSRRCGRRPRRERGARRGHPVGELRDFLAARLPGFMVPAAVHRARPDAADTGGEARPAGAAHPAIAGTSVLHGRYTPAQAGMSHLWSRMLKTGRVGLDDDFFELGGNSLLAAEMLARRARHVRDRRELRPAADPEPAAGPDAARLRAGHCRTPARAGSPPTAGPAHRLRPGGRGAGLLAGRSGARCRDRTGERPRERWRPPIRVVTAHRGDRLPRHPPAAGTAGGAAARGCTAWSGPRRRARAGADRGSRAAIRARASWTWAAWCRWPATWPSRAWACRRGRFGELARTVDVIHHVGALVNFIYPYEELRAANVTGTRGTDPAGRRTGASPFTTCPLPPCWRASALPGVQAK